MTNELSKADSIGENLDVAETLLIKTPRGDSLYDYVMNIYALGIKYSDSSSKKYYISLTGYNKETWLKRYFRKVPTIAAKTILSKFQNDLTNINFAVGDAGTKEK